MKFLRMSLIVASLSILSFANTKHVVLCKGFLPQNTLKRPVSLFQDGGLTEAQFNQVLDTVQNYYAPVISALGGQLQINRQWDDPTVNASAERDGNTWVLNMYGGLAREPIMNMDAFTLVACHEMGHHMGGAPKFSGGDWASVEGEADYYATLDCMRFLFPAADNQKYVDTHTIDPVLKDKCEHVYATQDERNLCEREGMAGLTVGLLFQELGQEKTAPSFNTPDPSQVSQTDEDHPGTQCRLDTYYQASICVHDIHQALSNTDYHVGTCTRDAGMVDGVRPLCWFSPNSPASAPARVRALLW